MIQKAGNYRWVVCALIFFATTINYLDRAVISVLKGTLEVEYKWTETDYSHIVISFQLAYALGMTVSGRFVDQVGTKIGYGIVIVLWSIASSSHALVSSAAGFMLARAGLGLTEAGNFPAAIKSIAEWFPKRERAFATGLFNSGTNIGAILAPVMVPFVSLRWGWQWAFIISGVLGLMWLVPWIIFYEVPARQKRLRKSEFDYITKSDADSIAAIVTIDKKNNMAGWSNLLTLRQTWAFIVGKLLTDPIWWFYLFWLPSFLKSEYHLDGAAISLPIALVYTISVLGSIYGGWLPLKLISKGWPVFKSRKISMLIFACCALPVIFTQYIGEINVWLCIIIIGIAAAANQAWSANMFTTVSDNFSQKTVGSVVGIGGMAGALGGIAMSWLAGRLLDHFKSLGDIDTGYFVMFCICGFSYLTAWVIIHFLNPRPTIIKVV